MTGKRKYGPPFERRRFQNAYSSVTGSVSAICNPTPANSWGPVSVTAQKATGYRKEMLDWVTPGWQDIVARGGIVNNPAWSVFEIYQETATVTGQHNTQDNVWTQKYNGDPYIRRCFGPSKSFVEPDFGSLVNEATVVARSEIQKPDVLALVTALELPKTISMLRDATLRLYTFVRAIKKGRVSPEVASRILGRKVRPAKANVPTKPGDYFSQQWLAYRYGWSPLMYDIQGWAQALGKKEVLPREHARGKASKVLERVQYTSLDFVGQPFILTARVQQNSVWQVRAYVLYEVDYSVLHSLRSFGVTSLPLTAWEVVPFSFVADWFVGVGDWLQAMEPRLGVTELATGYTTLRADATTRRIVTYSPKSLGNNTYPDDPGFVGKTDSDVVMTRSRKTSLPSVYYPPVRVKLNLKRVTDAISLVIGLRR